jgi:fatty aldehyde-generating acyl-ACP reductase
VGGETPRLTLTSAPAFAAIGHQEGWDQIAAVYRAMRPPNLAPVTDAVLRETVPWIPPRTVTRFHVAAAPAAPPVSGIYVDTFITPDDLALAPTRRLLAKVHDAIRAAEREGARVATLGGFASILLEAMPQPPVGNLVLTTGNTLTAALIVRGIERAARLLGRPLECETLLIIGATGDVGSACARCFAGRTRRLLLAARNRKRLEVEAIRLRRHGPVEESTDVAALLKDATLVIAAASAPAPFFSLAACHPEAVICDAGYPKNIRLVPEDVQRRRVFWGGMGVFGGGLWSEDGILEAFYRFPSPHTAHGCMLEGAVLAIAGRWEPFSTGRGHITPERIDEMSRLSCASGIALAPLFDAAGLWPEEASAR